MTWLQIIIQYLSILVIVTGNINNRRTKNMAELKITGENFKKEVLESDKAVLIDFWAPWCAPCRMMGPVIEKLAAEYDGKAKVGKVNVDEETELAQQFQVMSIPTIILMKNGKVVSQLIGARPKEELDSLLSANL